MEFPPVTIYTTPNCVQCMATKRQFAKYGIEYTEVALESVPEKLAEFKAAGHQTAPIVTTDVKIWSGFRLEKIVNLASYIDTIRASK